MTLIWSILIAFAVVVVIYQLVHRTLVKRATIIMQNQAQAATDQAVQAALKAHLRPANLPTDSVMVADVWGKGVMAFEYVVDMPQLNVKEQEWLTKENLTTALDQVGAPTPLVITDWWEYEHQLHVDVANLMNEATKEYVADLEKLDKA